MKAKSLDDVIINCSTFTKAIVNAAKLYNINIDEDAAKEISLFVLNFFGYDDRIIDNVLEPEDRDIFYILEDSGLLATEHEEIPLPLQLSKNWRIDYWVLNKENIRWLATYQKPPEETSEGKVYETLPAEVWKNHANPAAGEASA